MEKIKHLVAREIIDSRGNPTIEVDLVTSSGSCGRVAVPSGASTGSREAFELRDGDLKRFNGKGMTQAVRGVNTEIRDLLLGRELIEQEIDAALIQLDGTPNKRRLGANAILAVSLAAAKANAQAQGLPLYQHFHHLDQANQQVSTQASKQTKMCLPVPMINVLNGGVHASNSTDFQEFMIVPVGVENICEAIRAGSEIFQTLKGILKERKFTTTVGDEGGFAPALANNEEAVELLLEAIARAGYVAGENVYLALDVAASELYSDGQYHLKSEGLALDAAGLIALYERWIKQYPIVSIEDGLFEDDWAGWQTLTERLGQQVQLVGDDLFVTNKEQIRKGIDLGVGNSVLIKLNQIGTLSETLDAIQVAREADYSCIISHRSGETEDSTIADLAVATGVGQIKTGSLSRSDRVAKYNQLLRIHEEFGTDSVYAGKQSFGSFLS